MLISTFKIGEEFYGVDILLIKEIGHLQEVTPIPGAKSFNYGLMNLRGHVISIIHPMLFMNYLGIISPAKNRILIFKTDEYLEPLIEQMHIPKISLGNDSLGLIVDNICDVIEIDNTKSILPPTSNIPSRLMKVISGVIQQENNVILILDTQKLYAMICQNHLQESEVSHE